MFKKEKNIFSKKMQAMSKLLDIPRERRKTLKKEKEKRKMRKIQTTTIDIFLLLLFHVKNFIFC